MHLNVFQTPAPIWNLILIQKTPINAMSGKAYDLNVCWDSELFIELISEAIGCNDIELNYIVRFSWPQWTNTNCTLKFKIHKGNIYHCILLSCRSFCYWIHPLNISSFHCTKLISAILSVTYLEGIIYWSEILHHSLDDVGSLSINSIDRVYVPLS